MLHDRGVLKWTSMILPEHVKKLKELKASYEKEQKPEPDPQLLEEWNGILSKASFKGVSVIITTVIQGNEAILTGTVERLDSVNGHFSSATKKNTAFPFLYATLPVLQVKQTGSKTKRERLTRSDATL
ncbi:YolD-like family protein [Bacillus sp. H-16]|uniref:YolD-like family protein n=1 Tax=Alteribacter salitolerans TaxID=2912333 RepID=UPI001962D2EC|nr:YolD-like family protein [Alteribacter salitolerans]MBM7097228.1 YolD-like family protein [Alteribacter salitolerans]